MKHFSFLFTLKNLSCVLLLIFFQASLFSQTSTFNCNKVRLLKDVLNKYHYKPAELNDESSAEIFRLFIEMLDPSSLYFIQEDIDRLARFKSTLDDEVLKGNCVLLDEITGLYRLRLQQADSTISQFLSKPLDLKKQDTLFLKKENDFHFAKDQKTLKKIWEKWLKYQALAMIFASGEENKNSMTQKELLSKEEETRKKMLVKNKRFIQRILNNSMGFENFVASVFMNAVCSRFDPHTMFFSASQKEHFQSSISSEAMAYGFSLQENSAGDVQIERLAPGSPAWKSNLLHKGDILVKVQWPGKEAVDLTYSSVQEADNIILSAGSNEMNLTVKKTNGQVVTVTLQKEKLRMDENVIKSYILKGKRKVGYLSLPGFYGEFENPGLPGCANDVAKEILKLDKEQIEGIILDLRFNGGGSLKEAIDLIGIFIDEGPVCIYSEKNKKPQLIKDSNRGTVYNGPLIVLVNGQSASASELLAAALQDYNRALIVGSPTFGKASGQLILPMDTTVNPEQLSMDMNSKDDFVKVTMQKLYRINGSSHQQTGVIPDVILPGVLLDQEYKETTDPYSLSNDSISKKVISKKLLPLPVDEVKEQSNKRVKEMGSPFSAIIAINDSLKIFSEHSRIVPLELEAFRKEEVKTLEYINRLESIFKNSSNSFSASNNKYDLEVFEMDLYRKEINDVYLKNISEDIYIDEAYRIMNDLITLDSH